MTNIQQAMNLIKQGRKQEAQSILEGLIRTNPQDVTAWLWYAETIEAGPKKIKFLETCLKRNPGNAQVVKALEILRGRQSQVKPVDPDPPKAVPFPPSYVAYDEPEDAKDDLYTRGPIHHQDGGVPNIKIPANEKVLAYLKRQGSYHDLIVPFSFEKVNQNRTHSDVMGHFSAMTSLPRNAHYVIHGFPALVHPGTGIIVGFVIGTGVIQRLPENIVMEIIDSKLVNAYRVNSNPDATMTDLENNWISSWAITESLTRKTLEYYGKELHAQQGFHLNADEDLIKLSSSKSSRSLMDRLFPIGVFILVVLIVFLIIYILNIMNIL